MDVVEIIENAGRNLHIVYMIYEKVTTGEVKDYYLEPYSFRDDGKYFFGYDIDDETIKKFLVDNIIEIEETDMEYDPRWEVEF